MKTLTIGLISAAFASSAFAGDYVQSTAMQTTAPQMSGNSLYNAGEWQIDLFGAYAFTNDDNRRLIDDEVFGGGLGFNYFITRNFGIGAEGTLFNTDGDVLGTTAFNLLLRFPIAETGFAPYVFAGAGVTFNADDLDSDDFSDARDRVSDNDDPRDTDDVIFIGHAGGGLEYRFTPNFSVFGDARYTWTESDDADFGVARAGVRFAF